MLLHGLARSTRAGNLHLVAALALFMVGCGQEAPGVLEVNVGQNSTGDSSNNGDGGSTPMTTGAGGETTSGGPTTTAAGTGGGMPQEAAFVISLDTTSPQIELDDTLEMTVTIAPMGYTGAVGLTISDLGNGGITGDFASKGVLLDGVNDVTVKLTLTTMSSTPPGSLDISVTASVATGASTTTATLTVKPAITIVIPKNVYGLGGTKDNPYKMAFGDYPMNVIAAKDLSDAHPMTVRFFNDDDMAHEIHAGNPDQGFPHDPGPIPAHSMDGLVRKINAKGLYDFYLHDQNAAATIGRIAVQ